MSEHHCAASESEAREHHWPAGRQADRQLNIRDRQVIRLAGGQTGSQDRRQAPWSRGGEYDIHDRSLISAEHKPTHTHSDTLTAAHTHIGTHGQSRCVVAACSCLSVQLNCSRASVTLRNNELCSSCVPVTT